MTDFRLLTLEELQSLEAEFIRFLAAHSISAADWESWKTNNPGKMDEYITEFSKFIFHSLFHKTKYWVRSMTSGIQYVLSDDSQFSMIWIKYDSPSNVNPVDLMYSSDKTRDGFKIIKGQKEYTKSRNEELFQLVEDGFIPVRSDETERIEKLFGIQMQ